MKEIKKLDMINFKESNDNTITNNDSFKIIDDSYNTINNYNITNCNFNHLEDPIENSIIVE